MRRLGTFGAGASFAALGGLLLACSAVLGVDDPILDESAPPIDASAEADVSAPPVDAPPEAIAVDVGDTCATEQADETHGIFVSLGGVPAPNCGSKIQPCSKVQLGITRALAIAGTTTVYVDTGTYPETVSLAGSAG